ncbi:Os10g0198483 [Oryza sativa Japonica Group]|uniref:Os10g0198483 protein n=1 Tax=Oryza sativa subsp. japonica TaxID=39947 RepID=A0A0P0XTK5_ORYSJ|nr:Os10g0198483 [Oryza sativa Japonica Group]
MGLVDLSSLSAVKFHPDPEQKQDIELRADQFTCLVPPISLFFAEFVAVLRRRRGELVPAEGGGEPAPAERRGERAGVTVREE